ncbi:MAG: cytochrome-c peroxidase [Rhodospirillales bacterium]
MASPRIDLSAAGIVALCLALGAPQPLAADSALLGLPAVPFPADNPPAPEKIALGRMLFFDPRLSVDGRMSCATCHDPAQGFTTNDRPTPLARGGFALKRNAPTAINAAFEETLLWSGAMPTLEALTWGPLLAADEMANPSVPAVIERIAALPDYAGLFERAFAGQGPGKESIARAIAAFERSLVSAGSRFDRWWFGGEEAAVTQEERRGALLFLFRAGCAQCHTLDDRHALFSDGKFHALGAGAGDGLADPGRFEVTGAEEDRGKFRTPSLRNVALTRPYMHDGSIATLEEVVEFYDRGGGETANKAEWIFPLNLSAQDKRALAAFMRALTGANAEALARTGR